MTFAPGIYVIYGNNAQGKTNLLESIYLCSGNRSFRGAKEKEMTMFSSDRFEIRMIFKDRQREQEILYQGGEKRKITLNYVPLSSPSALFGVFSAVVFHPEDLFIIKEGPKLRREFLDSAISKVKPVYQSYLSQYHDILEQRNALLRSIRETGKGRELLSLWDEPLAKAGTAISLLRKDYLQKLNMVSKEIYSGFTEQKEQFSVCYDSSVFPFEDEDTVYSDSLIEQYKKALADSLEEDIRLKYTSVGIHRDDLDIRIDGLPARTYGSQGQQRSAAVTLKLSEAKLLCKITRENPVILLDDVMSELDKTRQDYILNQIQNFQVLITCCDEKDFALFRHGKKIRVEQGKFYEE